MFMNLSMFCFKHSQVCLRVPIFFFIPQHTGPCDEWRCDVHCTRQTKRIFTQPHILPNVQSSLQLYYQVDCSHFEAGCGKIITKCECCFCSPVHEQKLCETKHEENATREIVFLRWCTLAAHQSDMLMKRVSDTTGFSGGSKSMMMTDRLKSRGKRLFSEAG